MKDWIQDYLSAQQAAVASIDPAAIEALINVLKKAYTNDRRIFAIGNGGSAANASHFATDLGKGASDLLAKRFKVISLTDNTPWITALGNDYSYDDVFRRQLENYAEAGDVVLCMSVSGNSPNLVQAAQWARKHDLEVIALISTRDAKLADIAQHIVRIDDTHFGRVEDCHMTICHLLCYAFMEDPELRKL